MSEDTCDLENTGMQICRICLENSTKFYHIQKCSLDIFYELMTGITVEVDHMLPLVLCWECAYRLVSFWKFKAKAKKANEILEDIFKRDRSLNGDTIRSIQSIDRSAHKLTSSLSYKTFNVNHSDLHLHETELPKPFDDNYPNNISNLERNKQIYTLDLEIKDEDYQMNDKNDLFDDNYEKDFTIFDSFNENQGNGLKLDNNSNHSNVSSNTVLTKHKNNEKNEKGYDKKAKKHKNKEVPLMKVDKRRKPAKEVLNEDIFMITELNYEEQLLEVKRRQDSSNYKKSEFVCEKCYKGFLDEEAFNCHMIRHTDQSGSFECDICKVRFRTQHALRNHTTSHAHKFSCKKCVYVTTRRHAAKLHEEYHNGTTYRCPHCQEDFVKFSTYMSHVRLKHPSDFVCERCGYSFVSAKGLGLHKKLKHRIEEQLPVPPDGPYCERCEVRFATEEALHRHFKLSARHKETTESKEVNKTKEQRSTVQHSTKKKSQERRNKNSSKPEGPIPCEQCDMQLPDSLSYYRHFRRNHPDKNRTNYPSMKTKCMCEVCGKMFQSLALLHDHSFTHTDLKHFKCASCGKTFQRKYRLIAHRKLHASQRTTHACSVCGKLFTTTSNMQRHMVSHTGLRPFKCELCGKCFKHASEKRVHVTYVHLDKPWPKRRRGKRQVNAQVELQPATVPPEDHNQTVWLPPPCIDPKISDGSDKPLYYNLKM